MRRLRVTVPGRWYLALTIALGVVAMVSGNNVLYLIESLLLSGLILSGILSERTIVAVSIEWVRGRAISGKALPDRLRITNLRGFTLFCVEIGEWREGRLVPLSYVPRLAPRSSVTLAVQRSAGARGIHRWEGLAVATSYPFGFACKTRVLPGPGERIIWPAFEGERGRKPGDQASRNRLAGGEITEGELRAYDPQDDSRMIVWTASAKGQGPMVRLRRALESSPQVTLDLRTGTGEDFERQVLEAARPFHEASGDGAGSGSATLTLVSRDGTRRIHGRNASLDALALAEPETGSGS